MKNMDRLLNQIELLEIEIASLDETVEKCNFDGTVRMIPVLRRDTLNLINLLKQEFQRGNK